MVGDDDDTFRHASSLVHCLWLNWLMHASMMLVDDAKLCYRSSLGCEPIHAAPLLLGVLHPSGSEMTRLLPAGKQTPDDLIVHAFLFT